MESVLFNALLEYLRNQLNIKKIEYKEEPVKIPKGFAADKYVFTLNNAPEHLTQPLVVRIFGKTTRKGYAEGEAEVQNAVHNTGYPVPRVFFACSDKSVLDREFTVMEYKKGVNLSETGRHDIPEIVGRLHAELHSIDPSTLMKIITPEVGGTIRYSITEYLDEFIRKNNHTPLFPALEWVLDNRPSTEPPVICHGDFHAENILWDDDSVSAVLDWGAFRFEEPAWGVAYIIVKLRSFYPQRLHGVSLNVYIDRYFRSYNERRNIGRDRFSYFEAVGALNALNEIKTHINDLRARGTSTIQLLDRVEDDMINLFEEVSGVKIPNSVS
jgi:aminoglycoside phosphotransferase (APT) family kinase protein